MSASRDDGAAGTAPPPGDFSATHWLHCWADLARANLCSLRDWIAAHRDELPMREILRCLDDIDDVRKTMLIGFRSSAPSAAPREQSRRSTK